MSTQDIVRAGRTVRLALAGLLLFAVYHLARNVLTTFFDIRSAAVDVGHRPHAWCAPLCDYVTMPLELFNVMASAVVLRRRRVGKLGVVDLLTIPLWLFAWLAP